MQSIFGLKEVKLCIVLAMAKENTSNQEFQIVKSWLELEDPLGIVTHIDVDADAVFSAALLQTLRPCVPVHFVQYLILKLKLRRQSLWT